MDAEEREKANKQTFKEKIGAWYKSKSKKSLIVMGSCLIVLPLLLGVGCGILIDKFVIGKSTDYTNIDPNTLIDNQAEIMKKYNDAKESGSEYTDALTPTEMINVAYNLYADATNSMSITKGSANAVIVEQSIRAASIRNGDEYFEESLSKSAFVAVAARTYLHQSTAIDYYVGETTEAEKATWNKTPTQYTSEAYTEKFGKTPKTPLIYIVSSKTIIGSSNKVEKISDGYEVTLNLDPVKSVVNYVKQMKNISNLDDYPSFESVKTVFTLNNDLLIKELKVNEKYYAKTNGLGTDIEAELLISYLTGNVYSIPTIEQDFDYEVN